MRTAKLGGVDVPIVGQGTWQMESDDRATAVAALRRGIDLGMTHIDTAEMYGSGEVEELVGEAIDGRRDHVFLVSKVLPYNASRTGTVDACERSLERLGTDYLDLYLLHWPGSHALEDTFAAFEQLQTAGKIRAFGVSNFDCDELDRAYNLVGDRLACNQVLYHLQERGIEHSVMPWCYAKQVPIVAYSPFGQGFFPASGVGGGALEEIAEAHDATRYQVALAFLFRDDAFVIPKAATIAHVEDNAGAGDLVLSREEIDRIAEAFPIGPDRGLPTA